ncbi:hypothetical protein GN244_ATG00445 [Phytophthora infestans]|uniref:Uncharacterized protein n=1 Tax=Phytophthora infestans TaxID=4787 RepID=A0A833TI08_PHYIN|nr:hypothetical protein GN244_ATG00445 [Phytophthora infestans]KAF4139416.1 hypothetical protein GN958_ATG11317 [Phytophthora infestans]
MARIEEVAALERWKAQRLAQKLDADIQQLKVALSELDTVQPKKTTYTKKANVFFLEKRDVIVQTKKRELRDNEKKRHDVGLELRESSTTT